MIKLIKKYKSESALLAGLVLCLCFYFFNPFSLPAKSSLVLAVAVMMISWWVLDAMPMAAVALIPVVIFPLLDIAPLKEVVKSYADTNIFLFMGGFFIALGIEKWNLHKRIALGIIKITGTNGNRIILGFIIATGFLSLWLSNTATTMMMFPIATSVIHVISSHNKDEKGMKNFSLVLMLSLAYASNFAVGTIIGTPPNTVYVGYIHDKFNYSIGFMNWMMVFLPLTIVLLFMLYWVLVKFLYPNNIKHSTEGRNYINSELKTLGKLSAPEKRVLVVFLTTVFFWMFKDIINTVLPKPLLDDTIIAIGGALLLFIIPSGKEKTDNEERLLEWPDTNKMAWGILLLFGGGLALAKSLEDAQLMQQLGDYIAGFSTSNVFLMILIVTTLSVFLSEVMSNVAQVIVMAPVITAVATALHMDPLILGIPMTLGASCASMLPMGTPPNAIVFASGHIKLRDMVKTGFVLNIICIIFITLFCWLLQPLLMQLMP
jgi:solute carrier family 13 (sodium-dependent dicarboxylate transporter), member 2/3/5